MPDAKSETLTIRITPAVKTALRTAAAQDHRSVTNMVEVMIRIYCAREGIEIAEPARDDPDAPTRTGKPTRARQPT
jgi:hypothetical protein